MQAITYKLLRGILQEAGLEIGDALEAKVIEGKVILSPVAAELTLEELLTGSSKGRLAVTEEDREWLEVPRAGSEV